MEIKLSKSQTKIRKNNKREKLQLQNKLQIYESQNKYIKKHKKF